MSIVVNLDKLSEGISFNLEKRVADSSNFPKDINVTLALDVSGSMTRPFAKGHVLHALQRVVAVSNVVDDDGILNFFCFSYDGIPQKDIEAKADFNKLPNIVKAIAAQGGSVYWNGTYFAPVLSMIVDGHTEDTVTTQKNVEQQVNKPTFMSKLKSFFTGKPSVEVLQEQITTPGISTETKQLVILITDGDNFDQEATRKFFKRMQSNKQFYFQCIGVGCSNSFLQECSGVFSNVGYTELSSFTEDDDALATALVSDSVLRHFGY